MRAFVISLFSTMILSGCGFQPMYGHNGASVSEDSRQCLECGLDRVEIEAIPDRSGVYLRNALIDRFYKNGYPSAPLYKLSISKVNEMRRDLDITKSADTTRSQLIQTASMTLTDLRNPAAPPLIRTLSSITSYNTLSSEFATHVTEDNARLNGLSDLARQAELNISLYLKRTPR